MDKEQDIRFTNLHQQSKSANQRNWTQQQDKTAPYGKEQGVTYALWHQQLNFAAKIQGFSGRLGVSALVH